MGFRVLGFGFWVLGLGSAFADSGLLTGLLNKGLAAQRLPFTFFFLVLGSLIK